MFSQPSRRTMTTPLSRIRSDGRTLTPMPEPMACSFPVYDESLIARLAADHRSINIMVARNPSLSKLAQLVWPGSAHGPGPLLGDDEEAARGGPRCSRRCLKECVRDAEISDVTARTNSVQPSIIRGSWKRFWRTDIVRPNAWLDFLGFTVEQSLQGKGADLKEYLIGIGGF